MYKLRFVIAGLFMLTAACTKPIDHGRCLKEHQVHHDSYVIPQMLPVGPNGQLMTIMKIVPASDELVCDKWEFPNGRSQ